MLQKGWELNLYFVVDEGNRTDPTLVATALKAFASSLLHDKLDSMTIISDSGSSGYSNVLNTTSLLDDFNKAVQSFSGGDGSWYTINAALDQALKDIKLQAYGCSRSNIVIVLAGKNTLDFGGNIETHKQRIQDYIDNANTTFTKMDFLYFAQLGSDQAEESDFNQVATETHGLFRTITNNADLQSSLPMLNLESERDLFTATYRTNNGESDTRNVHLLYQGSNITKQDQTYTVSIANPTITINSPVDGTVIQMPYIGSHDTSKDLVDVEFTPGFPDGHPRTITSAILQVTAPSGTTKDLNSAAGAPSKFNWNISKYREASAGQLSIQVFATDEFGMTATSKPVSIKLNYAVQPSPIVGPTNGPLGAIWLYILSAIVVILLVVLIVMWRKIKALDIGGAVSHFVGEVRKTIVGGGRRKNKPLASLKVIDGPASMVNQELKIYSELVKLGRDPQKADLTFFTPDSNSSVSGLHCRIERIGGSWRIIPLSTSGSETFVDDQSLPFNEPSSLESGQTVRMGYLAQQPVVFQFVDEQGSEEDKGDQETRKTAVNVKKSGDDVTESAVRPTIVDREDRDENKIVPPDLLQNPPQSSSKDSDDPFAEYRDK